MRYIIVNSVKDGNRYLRKGVIKAVDILQDISAVD